jgi:hypothetical protein
MPHYDHQRLFDYANEIRQGTLGTEIINDIPWEGLSLSYKKVGMYRQGVVLETDPYPEYSLHKTKSSQSAAAASINLFIHHWEHGDPLCQANYMLTSKFLSISSSIIGSMEILCVRKLTCSHRSFCVEACSQLLSKRLVALHNTIASKGRHWQCQAIQSHHTTPLKWRLQYIDLNF